MLPHWARKSFYRKWLAAALLASSIAVGWPSTGSALPPESDSVPTNLRHNDPWAPPVGEFVDERLRLDTEYHGVYTTDRQLVQDGIVKQVLARAQPVEHPRIIFTAGAMGGGKSHVIKAMTQAGYLDADQFVYIDPDRIKELMPEYAQLKKSDPVHAATLVHRESAYIQEIALERALAEGRNIVLDGSFRQTRYFSALIQRIQKTHPQYFTEIVDIRVSPEIAKARGMARALETHRTVPNDVFETSVTASRQSVAALRKKVDRVITIDNNRTSRVVGLSIRGRPVPIRSFEVNEQARPKLEQILTQRPAAPLDNFTHVVFDLDWTLLSVPSGGASVDMQRVLNIDGAQYYLQPGVEEAIQALIKTGIKVSFFSGGDYTRNIKALKAIQLKDGTRRSLYDVAYRILSLRNLTPIEGAPPEARFSERFKKDLLKICTDIKRIVLVDDLKNMAIQAKNVVHLGQTYWPFESFAAAQSVQVKPEFERFVPKTEAEWFVDRMRVPAAVEVILQALKRAQEGHGEFADLVAELSAQDRLPFAKQSVVRLGLKQPSCVSGVAGALEH